MKKISVLNGYKVWIEEKQYTVIKDKQYEGVDKTGETMLKTRTDALGYWGTMGQALIQIARLVTNENVADGATILEYLKEFNKTKKEIEQIISSLGV